MNMAETTMGIVVPVSAGLGNLTDEEYEEMVLAAMPSMTTEVAEPVAVEPEKPVDDPIVVTEAPKPKRVCSKCGHADGNSVGKIKLALLVQIERDGLKLWGFEPICNPCAEGRMSPEERRHLMKIGALYGIVGVRNAAIRAEAAAVDYWKAVVVGTAEPLQALRDEKGRVVCGVPNCLLHRDDEFVTRYAIVKDKDGKRAVAGICREQYAVLIKAGALRSIQLFDYRGAQMEIERRNKKDADQVVSPPKQPEPKKPAVATEVKPQLSRAEREARRWDRRRKLALAVGNTRFGAGKRHKGGQKGSNGGGKKR
ncbi:MAG: hypothetical protein WC348_02585 [Patescibacteria group bacterium]|jgi:hypothetical protein